MGRRIGARYSLNAVVHLGRDLLADRLAESVAGRVDTTGGTTDSVLDWPTEMTHAEFILVAGVVPLIGVERRHRRIARVHAEQV